MNKHGTTAILAAVCLLAGCADNSKKDGCTNCDHEHPSGTAAGTAAPAPAVFVAEPPTGEATPIPEARKKLKPGDEVLLSGMVMGLKEPFVESRAVFVLGDRGTLVPCNERHSDRCKTPWDNCCDDPAAKVAGTATIQVLDDNGKVLPQTLKGAIGLKELSRVVVAGKVAPNASEDAFVVNATAIHVVK